MKAFPSHKWEEKTNLSVVLRFSECVMKVHSANILTKDFLLRQEMWGRGCLSKVKERLKEEKLNSNPCMCSSKYKP